MLITVQELILHFSTLFVVNFAAIFVLTYFLYYKRYHDKKAFITYILFNIFLFTVVFFLIRNNSVVSLGFAIFGILSLIRLRSDTFTKIEITYFFISMSIALLNGMVGSEHIVLMIGINIVLLFLVWILDNPNLFQNPQERIMYKLDSVPRSLLSNTEDTLEILSKAVHAEVTDYEIIEVDAVRDSTKLRITYKK